MLPAQKESRLIGSIYDAALDPEQWPDVLEKLRQIANADKCNIIFYDKINRYRNRLFTSGQYSADSYKKYLDKIIDTDIAVAMNVMNDAPSNIFHPYDRYRLISDKKYQAYLEYVKDEVHEGPLIASELLRLNQSYCCASLIRCIGSAPFGELELSVLNRLAPHLSKAIQIFHSLHTCQQEKQNLEAILKASATAIILLSHSGKILLANAESLRIVEEHPAITICRNGYLHGATEATDLSLQSALQSRISSGSQNTLTPVYLPIPHPLRTHPLKLTIVGLSSTAKFIETFPGAAAAVLLLDPQRRWSIPADYLRDAYKLTKAEISIAQELVNGADTSQLAHNRGTTQQTLKGQIKRLLNKVNCPNQAALIQLLVAICADFSDLINW